MTQLTFHQPVNNIQRIIEKKKIVLSNFPSMQTRQCHREGMEKKQTFVQGVGRNFHQDSSSSRKIDEGKNIL